MVIGGPENKQPNQNVEDLLDYEDDDESIENHDEGVSILVVLLSRVPLFRFPTMPERGSGELNVSDDDHRSELFKSTFTQPISSNSIVYTSHFMLLHFIIFIAVIYVPMFSYCIL